MLACDTRETWTQFLQFVKAKCSPATFGNWFSPIRLMESASDEIVLEVPNIFVQEYLLDNFKEVLCNFLPLKSSGEPAIRFILAAEAKCQVATPNAQPEPAEEEAVEVVAEELHLAQVFQVGVEVRFGRGLPGLVGGGGNLMLKLVHQLV